METKKMPEKVWLTIECDGIPEGSCIHVQSETATSYTGIWASNLGSFPITVEKDFCTETNDLDETFANVRKHLQRKK